jgi:peptide/nickel transport system substrate-binding protein
VVDRNHDSPTPDKPATYGHLTRATLLRRTATAAMLGVSPWTPLRVPFSKRSGDATPHRGGTLRVGMVGGGTAETLNPYTAITPIDSGRVQSLYDPLVLVNADLTQSPGLALEWNPNRSATVYEVKLRPGVTFHNGKTLGADDVVYSIQQMAKPTSAGLPFVSGINLRDLKAINKTTVRIPLKFPDGDLATNFVFFNTWIVPAGQKDYRHPVGTGPFMAESFTPGQQSIFKGNPNYWVTGKPYVDRLQISSISDPAARLNALLSGQIDALAQLPTQEAKAHAATGDIQVLVAKSPQAMMFYMDTTKPPFNDNRVRQAIRLIADRKALVATAINGYGTIANDIIGEGLPFYDNALPQREQDIPKAKSLLKSAGKEHLTVELQTSDIFPGFVEAATLLAQQATAAGVTMNLKQVASSSYYNPSLLYLKMRFAETQWPVTSLKYFYLQALAANAPYNETHWRATGWNALLYKAIGELNRTKAQAYWNQLQTIQYNSGGYLNWTNADWVDALSKKVQGLKPSAAGALGNLRFLDAWLSS